MKRKTAYVYTRVSTMVQVDGKSLEGQLKEIEQYCQAFGIDILSVYSDEGKSGKSIAGRLEFQKMLKAVEEKEEVDYIIVWKLSRFGRNARETLNSLEFLQQHGADLIAVEERIDSSDKMGRFMLTMLSALAEMERENIIEQTKNGKKYTALDGKWNGGAAPYGYKLVDKKLVVVPEEAEVVKQIFDLYVNTDMGYNGVTGWLNKNRIPTRKLKRLDKKAMLEQGTGEPIYIPDVEDWYAKMVKNILECPVYYGKIRWGGSTTIRENGRERRVKGLNPILVNGQHEAIISEELWMKAQAKQKISAIPFGKKDSPSEEIHNTFNRIAKCPNCGHGMVSHKEIYTTANGEKHAYYKYICGYFNNHKNGKCRPNSIKANYLEGAVVDAIHNYIKQADIADAITENLGKQLDTTAIEEEIRETEEKLKELDKNEDVQYNILSQLGLSGKYRNIKPEKIEKNLEKINTQREELKAYIEQKMQEIEAIEQDHLNSETIRFLISNFDKAYTHATKEQRKKLVQSMVKEVRLGYGVDGKSVIPVSMTIQMTGEQIDLVRELSELETKGAETVVLMSRVQK